MYMLTLALDDLIFPADQLLSGLLAWIGQQHFVKNINFFRKFQLHISYGQVKFDLGELILHTHLPRLAIEAHFLSYTLYSTSLSVT